MSLIFESFIDKVFSEDKEHLISVCNSIIAEYQRLDLDLTLRQLYYQFVARGYLENDKRSYANLGALVSQARLAGRIPWNAITDRTRNRVGGGGWGSPENMLRASARQYHLDLWEGQQNHVEVWVEKEALVGVVEAPATEMNVPYFACRGYVSLSEMYEAAMRFKELYADEDRITYIIHLGDHDPSGIDMTRDLEDRLNMFVYGSPDWRGARDFPVVRIKRIALNMDQVRQYRPPPNPAKITDPRAKTYLKTHGAVSWELDALEPRLLQRLILDSIKTYANLDKMEPIREQQERERDFLQAIADDVDTVDRALGGIL